MFAVLLGVILLGWIAAATLGTMAYFRGEQRKPIHERNWRSGSFEKLSQSITNKKIDYAERVPAFIVSE
jgi:hypothetical protein